jgi:hypothetical protein
MAEPPKPLCDRCRAEEERWTHVDPAVARGIAIATGRPAIETMRDQLRIIRTHCRENH